MGVLGVAVAPSIPAPAALSVAAAHSDGGLMIAKEANEVLATRRLRVVRPRKGSGVRAQQRSPATASIIANEIHEGQQN